jgi:hypothetical protein
MEGLPPEILKVAAVGVKRERISWLYLTYWRLFQSQPDLPVFI